jgi:hypothetical protein
MEEKLFHSGYVSLVNYCWSKVNLLLFVWIWVTLFIICTLCHPLLDAYVWEFTDYSLPVTFFVNHLNDMI